MDRIRKKVELIFLLLLCVNACRFQTKKPHSLHLKSTDTIGKFINNDNTMKQKKVSIEQVISPEISRINQLKINDTTFHIYSLNCNFYDLNENEEMVVYETITYFPIYGEKDSTSSYNCYMLYNNNLKPKDSTIKFDAKYPFISINKNKLIIKGLFVKDDFQYWFDKIQPHYKSSKNK